MRQQKVLKTTTIALAVVMNIIGAQAALILKLPIYLDTIGTVFTSALLGPIYGMVTGLLSAVITGIGFDIYSLYFFPVQMITGIMAGILFQKKWVKHWRLFLGCFAVTIPGTAAAALISAFLFGGFTSSGSSFLVMILRKAGMHPVLSVFLVQTATDYPDRLLTIGLVLFLTAALPREMVTRIRGRAYEPIQ